MESKAVHVALITRRLHEGGAQRQILETAQSLSRNNIKVSIVTMYSGGAFEEAAKRILGVNFVSLDKSGRYDILGSIRRYLRFSDAEKVNLTWSYAGGVEYGYAFKILRKGKFVLGIRHAGLDKCRFQKLRELSFRVAGITARLANLIVANSLAGRRYLHSFGFPSHKILVVPNGFDTERFDLFPELRARVRAEWGYTDDTILVGIVGRIDPLKDHETFLRTASLLAKTNPSLRFVCVGDGRADYRQTLQTLAGELDLDAKLLWAGSCSDMPAVYNALDILVLCSISEGTPNVVGEAMASCTPCVATRVGDAAALLGDESRTVPPQDIEALAGAIARVATLDGEDRRRLGCRDRERIATNYSKNLLAGRTEAVIFGVMDGKPANEIERQIGLALD